MGIFTKDIKTFDDLFLHQLEDVYYAENQITKALPKMVEKATAADLKKGFELHLQETEVQIERLERIFALIGQKPKAVTFLSKVRDRRMTRNLLSLAGLVDERES